MPAWRRRAPATVPRARWRGEAVDEATARRLLEAAVDLARAAAVPILRIYQGDFEVFQKADRSPVTAADVEAEAVIVAGLEALDPRIPVVSEEACGDAAPVVPGERFWLVDPLDGTREFVRKNGEFTVNIALVEHGRPLLGVVYAPVHGRLFAGRVGGGAFEEHAGERHPIACRPVPAAGWTLISSRSHGDAGKLAQVSGGQPIIADSVLGSSLKFCVVAAGEADLYPRFGRTMEWDTAAGHAVLRAAGGCVADLQGVELRYGKAGLRNPDFLAWGTPAPAWVPTQGA